MNDGHGYTKIAVLRLPSLVETENLDEFGEIAAYENLGCLIEEKVSEAVELLSNQDSDPEAQIQALYGVWEPVVGYLSALDDLPEEEQGRYTNNSVQKYMFKTAKIAKNTLCGLVYSCLDYYWDNLVQLVCEDREDSYYFFENRVCHFDKLGILDIELYPELIQLSRGILQKVEEFKIGQHSDFSLSLLRFLIGNRESTGMYERLMNKAMDKLAYLQESNSLLETDYDTSSLIVQISELFEHSNMVYRIYEGANVAYVSSYHTLGSDMGAVHKAEKRRKEMTGKWVRRLASLGVIGLSQDQGFYRES